MPTKAVRVTELLVGKNSLGYLSLVPGASVLIRQNGVALVGSAGPGTPAVFSDNDKTAMTNPVPTGVSQGTAGVDTEGRLVIYLNPGKGYDVQATVGNVTTTASLPDVGVDVEDVQAPIPSGTYAETPSGDPATAVVQVRGLVGTGAASDRAAIQSAMNLASLGPGSSVVRVPKVAAGICALDAPLVIYSNTRLVVDDGVTITRTAGYPGGNLLVNAAVSTTASGGMDGAATAGSTAVTSTAFTTGNVGQAFTIWGPGPQYAPLWGPMHGTVTAAGAGTLNSRTASATTASTTTPTVNCTTITDADLGQPVAGTGIPANAYVGAVVPGQSFLTYVAGAPANSTIAGATTITIGGNAVNTVSAMYVSVGPRDKNIVIEGGHWDNAGNTGTPINSYCVRIRRCDGFRFHKARHSGTNANNGTYAIDLGDVTDYYCDDHDFAVRRDGFHIEGPSFHGRMSNLRGRTGDDFIGMTVGNYAAYQDTFGPIVDVEVDGIEFDNGSSGVAVIGNSQVFPFDDIRLRNFSGHMGKGSIVRAINDAIMTGGTRIETLTIDNVTSLTTNQANPISIAPTICKSLRIRGGAWRGTSPYVYVTGGRVNHLSIDGLEVPNGMVASLITVSGQVDRLTTSNMDVTLGALGKILQVTATGICPRWDAANVTANGLSQGYFLFHQAGAAAITVNLANCLLDKLAYGFQSYGTATVNMVNVQTNAITQYLYDAANAATVLTINETQVTKTGGAAERRTGTLTINTATPDPYVQEAIVAALDVRYMQSVSVSVATANRALFFRIPGNFCAERAITKLRAYVQTTSGNWDLGVYSDNGSGLPGEAKARFGGGAMPVAGAQLVTIPSTVAGPGDWLAISTDNNTAAFLGSGGSIVGGLGAMMAYQDTAYPLPATAAATKAAGRSIYIEGVA